MGIRAEAAIRVDETPDRVFAVLTDPARFHEWQTGMAPAAADTGDVGVGSRLRGRRRLAGIAVPFTAEIVAWQPPRHLAFRSMHAPMQVRGDYLVAEEAGGSRITMCLRISGGWWSRLPPTDHVREAVTQQLERDLAAFAQLLDRPSEQAGR